MQAYNTNLLRKIRQHIKNGGVIAYPTEFCYGLGCDPFNYKAIEQILKIKKRNKAKGLIVAAGHIDQLKYLTLPFTNLEKQQLKQYWPGFYSIILPAANHVLKILTGQHNKLAIRISQHDLIRQMCHFLYTPLVSTSANYSGCKPIKTYRECARQFGAKVMVLPGIINFAKSPSTIIDWETKKVLR